MRIPSKEFIRWFNLLLIITLLSNLLFPVSLAFASTIEDTPINNSYVTHNSALATTSLLAIPSAITKTVTTNYEYDPVGAELQQIIDGDTSVYLNDAERRLAAVEGQNNAVTDQNLPAAQNTTTVEYHYNGDGHLVGKTVDGVRTDFALDIAGGLPEVIYTTDGESYLHLPGVIMTENADGERRYLLGDGLGSIRQVVDEQGNVVASYEFDPYGNPVNGDGGDPYGYTGEWWEDEVGLLHLRNRWYMPETGTFLSEDPWEGFAGRSQSMNGYSYVEGNPVRYADPTGQCILIGLDTLACIEVAAAAAAGFYLTYEIVTSDVYQENAKRAVEYIESQFNRPSPSYSTTTPPQPPNYCTLDDEGLLTGSPPTSLLPPGAFGPPFTPPHGPIQQEPPIIMGPVSPEPANPVETYPLPQPQTNPLQPGPSLDPGIDLPNVFQAYYPGKPYTREQLSGATLVRKDKARVNSPSFKDYIRQVTGGFKQSHWEKVMETWQFPNGSSVENHYWRNKRTGETWHHD